MTFKTEDGFPIWAYHNVEGWEVTLYWDRDTDEYCLMTFDDHTSMYKQMTADITGEEPEPYSPAERPQMVRFSTKEGNLHIAHQIAEQAFHAEVARARLEQLLHEQIIAEGQKDDE